MVKYANSIICYFILRNKTHYIFESQLVQSYEKHGLKALDFLLLVRTFRISWIRKCLYVVSHTKQTM